MPATTEAVSIDRIVAPPLAPQLGKKLDGPLTKLLECATPEMRDVPLMVRFETQHVPAARTLIEGLQGTVIKEVPWVDRGTFVHAVVPYERIPTLASNPSVYKVGLLQTFVAKR